MSKKIIYSIYFIVYLTLITIVLISKINGNFLGYNVIKIISNSMDGEVYQYDIPSFEVGDYVILKVNDNNFYQELSCGDVITFKMNSGSMVGNTVTHRIIDIEYKIDLDTYIITTLGDNNHIDNTEVLNSKIDQIYGKVVVSNEFINTFFYLITNKIFTILFILTPSIIFLGYETLQLVKKMRKD